MDSLRIVLVCRGYDLNDFVPRELKLRNVSCTAVHQVGVKDAQYTLMSNDQKVVLLALQLQNDWLQSDSQVMVRLTSM